jgi:hypothetical protein
MANSDSGFSRCGIANDKNKTAGAEAYVNDAAFAALAFWSDFASSLWHFG